MSMDAEGGREEAVQGRQSGRYRVGQVSGWRLRGRREVGKAGKGPKSTGGDGFVWQVGGEDTHIRISAAGERMATRGTLCKRACSYEYPNI